MVSETIGQRIRYLRVQHKIRAQDLAKRAGIHPSSLSQIENDRRTPDTDTLDGIARALNITTAKLVDGASLTTGGHGTQRDHGPTQAPATLVGITPAALSEEVRAAVAAALADIFVTIAASLGDYQAKELHGEDRSVEPRTKSLPRTHRR